MPRDLGSQVQNRFADMEGIPALQTERLKLRAFLPADAGMVQKLVSVFEIADMTMSIPHPYEEGYAETWIRGHQSAFGAGRSVTFAITLKGEEALIGSISLMSIEPRHQAELGFWIGVPFWGNGYCTEAARRVVEYAFIDLRLERLHADCFLRNPASAKVIEKIGFESEGIRRKHLKKWSKFEDLSLYGYLKTDWSQGNS